MMFTRMETLLLLLLFAVTSALAVCLALVWMQFLKLADRQLRLAQDVTEQLRRLFTVFNDKLSRDMGRQRREAEGAEQKLSAAVERKLEDVQELVNELRALEAALEAQNAASRPPAADLPTAKEARSGFSVFTREKKG